MIRPGLSSFLQSPEWEEFQRSLGRRTWRVGGALIIGHDLPLGLNYLYCPRPQLEAGNWRPETGFLKIVGGISQKEGSIFLKIDPAKQLDLIYPASRLQRPAAGVQPRQTIMLDLVQSQEELLAAMHEKTRYNIKLAERKGVEVTIHVTRNTKHDFEIFWGLLRETAARDGFHSHKRMYYEKLFDVRSGDFSNELFFAEYRGKIIAAALVNFYRSPTSIGIATYLHGASSREYKQVMAPHLLHWRIVQEAKRRGFRYYDFWGIDEERWPGLTRFKKGFGGAMVSYPPSLDIVYRPASYAAYRLWKRFLGR